MTNRDKQIVEILTGFLELIERQQKAHAALMLLLADKLPGLLDEQRSSVKAAFDFDPKDIAKILGQIERAKKP